MKRIIYLLIPVLSVLAILTFMFLQSPRTVATRHTHPKPPSYPFEEAEKIAQANLPRFIESVGSNYAGFGFMSEDELKRATLGKPYLIYSFDARLMADSNYRRADFRDSLDGGTTIEFPVLVDDQPRSNMTVVYRDGSWQDGSWGGYRPDGIVAAQRWLASQGIDERVDLVSFGLAWTAFGMVEYKGQLWLIPFHDNAEFFPSLDMSTMRFYALDEVLPLVHEQAKIWVEESDRMNMDLMLTPRPTQRPREALPTLLPNLPAVPEGPLSTETPLPGVDAASPDTQATPTLTLSPPSQP